MSCKCNCSHDDRNLHCAIFLDAMFKVDECKLSAKVYDIFTNVNTVLSSFFEMVETRYDEMMNTMIQIRDNDLCNMVHLIL